MGRYSKQTMDRQKESYPNGVITIGSWEYVHATEANIALKETFDNNQSQMYAIKHTIAELATNRKKIEAKIKELKDSALVLTSADEEKSLEEQVSYLRAKIAKIDNETEANNLQTEILTKENADLENKMREGHKNEIARLENAEIQRRKRLSKEQREREDKQNKQKLEKLAKEAKEREAKAARDEAFGSAMSGIFFMALIVGVIAMMAG